MRTEQARQNMILRMLHMDADEDDEEEETEEATPEVKGGANTRLPYGLCKRFNISLPDKATPHEAWEALEGKGVHAREAFAYLKQHGTIEGFEPKAKQSKSESSNLGQDKSEPSNKQESSSKKKAVEFTPAKTIKEAEDYAKNTLGISKCLYKGLNVEVANTLNKCIAETIAIAPKLKGTVMCLGNDKELTTAYYNEVSPLLYNALSRIFPAYPKQAILQAVSKAAKLARLGSDDYAALRSQDFNSPAFTKDEQKRINKTTGQFRGIYINPKFAKSITELEAQALIDESIGWHPQGCKTAKSILDHEIGHGLDDAYGLCKNKDILDFFDSLTACNPSDSNTDAVKGAFERLNLNKIKDELSIYAGKQEYDAKGKPKHTKEYFVREFIAEAWSEYRNNPNPRPIAAKVGEIIMGVIEND